MATATTTKATRADAGQKKADLEDLADLEKVMRTCIELLTNSEAAADRLAAAGYVGADWVAEIIGQGLDSAREAGPAHLLRALEITRNGAGDLGQHTFYFSEIDLEQELGPQLAAAMENQDENRVTALYGYLFAKGLLPMPATV
jgi:hypothetical protein